MILYEGVSGRPVRDDAVFVLLDPACRSAVLMPRMFRVMMSMRAFLGGQWRCGRHNGIPSRDTSGMFSPMPRVRGEPAVQQTSNN